MAQRLVRTLCPHCKKPMPAQAYENELWDTLVAPWKLQHPEQLQRQTGCLECRMTGYMGRVGIYEILMMSPELRKLITSETDISRVRAVACHEGMKPLRISGASKISAGITTLEEVIKVAPASGQL